MLGRIHVIRRTEAMMTHKELFKALADETRLRCVVLLSGERDLCVCELCYATGLSQPKISRHLALLRTQGIVVDHRQGQWVFYQIRPDLPQWIQNVLRMTSEGIGEENLFAVDRTRLTDMQSRPERCVAA